jgi:radical S-adenosyl methionine domain-containing protein 2
MCYNVLKKLKKTGDKNKLDNKLNTQEEYVVNLHILEHCNFKCRYCFAHFQSPKMLELNNWKQIIDNISNSIKVKRFNIAGGEPMLYPHLQDLIDYIHSKGIKVSLITNAYKLTKEFIKINKNKLEIIGISVDSLDSDTLMKMRCCTTNNNILDKNKFVELAKVIKYNGIKLKVNTVVNVKNYRENLAGEFKYLDINRWKILKMKEFKNDSFNNTALSISNHEFDYFLNNNKGIENIVVEESLANSYIIIDAKGYLVDNSGDDYKDIVDAKSPEFKKKILTELNLDKELYFSRY